VRRVSIALALRALCSTSFCECKSANRSLWVSLDLLRPNAEEDMESWHVSDKVENIRNNWAKPIELVLEDQPKPKKITHRNKRKKEPPIEPLFDE